MPMFSPRKLLPVVLSALIVTFVTMLLCAALTKTNGDPPNYSKNLSRPRRRLQGTMMKIIGVAAVSAAAVNGSETCTSISTINNASHAKTMVGTDANAKIHGSVNTDMCASGSLGEVLEASEARVTKKHGGFMEKVNDGIKEVMRYVIPVIQWFAPENDIGHEQVIQQVNYEAAGEYISKETATIKIIAHLGSGSGGAVKHVEIKGSETDIKTLGALKIFDKNQSKKQRQRETEMYRLMNEQECPFFNKCLGVVKQKDGWISSGFDALLFKTHWGSIKDALSLKENIFWNKHIDKTTNVRNLRIAMVQMVHALHNFHEIGYHCDISPSQFLLERTEDGFRVLLGDPGLAVKLGEKGGPEAGRRDYLPPEERVRPRTLSRLCRAPSDYYALGLIWYQLGSGHSMETGMLHTPLTIIQDIPNYKKSNRATLKRTILDRMRKQNPYVVQNFLNLFTGDQWEWLADLISGLLVYDVKERTEHFEELLNHRFITNNGEEKDFADQVREHETNIIFNLRPRLSEKPQEQGYEMNVEIEPLVKL